MRTGSHIFLIYYNTDEKFIAQIFLLMFPFREIILLVYNVLRLFFFFISFFHFFALKDLNSYQFNNKAQKLSWIKTQILQTPSYAKSNFAITKPLWKQNDDLIFNTNWKVVITSEL